MPREPFDWGYFDKQQGVEIAPQRREPFDWGYFGSIPSATPEAMPTMPEEPLISPPERGYVPIPAPIMPKETKPVGELFPETPKEALPAPPTISPEPYKVKPKAFDRPPGFLGPIEIPKGIGKRSDDPMYKLDDEQWRRTLENIPDFLESSFKTMSAGLFQAIGEMPLNFAFGPDIGTLAPGMAERSANLVEEAIQQRADIREKIAGKAPFTYKSEYLGEIGKWEMGFWQDAALSAAESFSMVAPTIPFSVVTGSPAPTLSTFFVGTFGSSYATARAHGIKPGIAFSYALADAGIEVLTELPSARALLKSEDIFSKIINMYAKEMPWENVATITQRLNARLHGVEGDYPWPVFFVSLLEDIKLTSATVALTSPAQATTARATQKAFGMPSSMEEAYGMELYRMVGDARMGLLDPEGYARKLFRPENAQLRSIEPEDVPINLGVAEPSGYFATGPIPSTGETPAMKLEIRQEAEEGTSLVGTRVNKGGISGLVIRDYEGLLTIVEDNGEITFLDKDEDTKVTADISNDPDANIEVDYTDLGEVTEETEGIEEPAAMAEVYGIDVSDTLLQDITKEATEVINTFVSEDNVMTEQDFEVARIVLESRARKKYGQKFVDNLNEAIDVLHPDIGKTPYTLAAAYNYANKVENGEVPKKKKKPKVKIKTPEQTKMEGEAKLKNLKVKEIREAISEVRDNPDMYSNDEEKVEFFINTLYGTTNTLSADEIDAITRLGVEELAFALEEGTIDDAEAILRSADLAQPTPNGFEMKEADEGGGENIQFSKVSTESLEEETVELTIDMERQITQEMKDIIAGEPAQTLINELMQNSLDAFPKRGGSVISKNNKTNVIVVYHSEYVASNPDYQGRNAINDYKELLGVDEDTAHEHMIKDSKVHIIKFADNGTGMTKEEAKKKLLVIGGKGKDATISAGGFGKAKQALFIYPEYVIVRTTKNGITTILSGSRTDFLRGNIRLRTEKTGAENGTLVEMRILSDNPYGEFETWQLRSKLNNAYKRTFGNVVLKISVGNIAPSTLLEVPPDWYNNPMLIDDADFDSVANLASFSEINYYQPIINKKLSGEWNGNKYDIYIVNGTYGYQDSDMNFWKVNTIWMSQGLEMNIQGYRYPVAFIPKQSDRPQFYIRVNFTKLVDTGSPNYPYIDNRKRVQTKLQEHITQEIKDLISKANQEEMQKYMDAFKELYDKSPEHHGVKVMIPFTDEAVWQQVDKLLDDNTEVIADMLQLYSDFTQLLKSIGETPKEFIMTVDPRVHGWRAQSGKYGFELYAINPFAVVIELANNSRYQKLLAEKIRTEWQLQGDNMMDTFIHEYAHNKANDHGKNHEQEMVNVMFAIGSEEYALFARRIGNVYHKHGAAIKAIGETLGLLSNTASLLGEEGINAKTPGSLDGAGEGRIDFSTVDSEEETSRARVRSRRTLFGRPRSDVIGLQGAGFWKGLYSKIDVETPWRVIGAPEVGFHLKNYASVKEFYDQETLRIIRQLTNMGFVQDQESGVLEFSDISLMAEDPRLLAELSPNDRARFEPAVNLVREYFDDTYNEFEALGVLQNPFPQSKILRLRDEIDKARIRLEDPEIDDEIFDNLLDNIAEWQSQISILANLKFVHIPAGLILEDIDLIDPRSAGRYRYMRILNQKRRKTISLQQLIDDEIASKEDMDIRDIIANYGRRKGNDIAIHKIAQAVHRDGLSKKAKRKINDRWVRIAPPEGYVHMGDRYPAFNDYYVQRDVATFLTKFFEYSYRLTGFDRFLAVIKGLQFERPDIMLWNNTVQGIMLGSLRSLKTPWYLVEGFKQVMNMGPLYKEAVYNGLLSKPNNNPFAHYLEMVQHAKKPVLQKFFQISNFTPWGAVKQYYNAAFYVAWKLDEGMRMASYLYLRNNEKFSPREAAQLAALAHADYASVPPEVRRALNRIWFTPTFKITMGKLWAQSIAATAKSPINLAQDVAGVIETGYQGVRTLQGQVPDGERAERIRRRISKSRKVRRLFSIALTAGAINLAIDIFMRLNGFDTDEEDMYWGVKYKKTFQTEEGPKELVISFSHPANLFLKFFWRAYDATQVPISGWAQFLKSIKYEFHPFWRTLLYDISINRRNNGELIWSPGDDWYVQVFKALAYMNNQFVGLMGAISEEVFATDEDKEAAMRMAKEFGPITGRLLDLFGTAYMRNPKINQILNQNRKLKTLMMEESEKGQLTPDKQQEYLRKLMDNSKKIENEMRRKPNKPKFKIPLGMTTPKKLEGVEDSENPVAYIVGKNANRLGYDIDSSMTNLSKMARFFSLVENDGKLTGKNPTSSAKGMYQIIDETFSNTIDYMIQSYQADGVTPPKWLVSASVHGNPNRLNAEQQTSVMLANLFRTKGTDGYLKMVMGSGDIEAMKKLYLRYHHTRPNKRLVEKVDTIFRG